jgi:hypothetical protein
MFGNEVQASEAEGLKAREDGRCPQPSTRGYGKLQQAEVNRIAQAYEAEGVGDEGHPITGTVDPQCPPHGWCQTVGYRNGRQLNQLKVCIVHRDWK